MDAPEPEEPVSNFKKSREWHIPDFALMVSRDPKDLVCIPLIIVPQVRGPWGRQSESVDQLQEQARILFADFGSLQEAGVGMYWW